MQALPIFLTILRYRLDMVWLQNAIVVPEGANKLNNYLYVK